MMISTNTVLKKAVKEAGRLREEGKTLVQDGDIMEFRFNVRELKM